MRLVSQQSRSESLSGLLASELFTFPWRLSEKLFWVKLGLEKSLPEHLNFWVMNISYMIFQLTGRKIPFPKYFMCFGVSGSCAFTCELSQDLKNACPTSLF